MPLHIEENPPKLRVGFYLPETVVEALEDVADKKNMSRNEVLTKLVKAGLPQYFKQEK